MTLKNKITSLAEEFSAGILAAIKSASLQELLAESGAAPRRGPGRPAKVASEPAAAPSAEARARARGEGSEDQGGRLVRRSPEDIDKVVALVVGALKKAKGGLRSEQLQKELGISKKEIVRPIEQALVAKKITKKGQKRATTYFAR